jgi:hypothetical protein
MCAWVAKAPVALSGDMVTISVPGSFYDFNAWAAFKGGAQTHDVGSGLPAANFGAPVTVSSAGSSGLIIGMVNPSVAPYVVDSGFTTATSPSNPANIEHQIFSTQQSNVKVGVNGGHSVSAVIADIWD